MEKGIEFEVLGIGEALKRNRLKVPPNQREYSWTREIQVKDLLQDLSKAMRSNNDPYFLGTVVLTKGEKDFLEIADGQQRLATTTILFAAIRDWFDCHNDEMIVQGIENDFLFSIDFTARERLPRLTLNLDDNEFFINAILTRKKDRISRIPTRRSHKLISGAANEIKDFLNSLERQMGSVNMKDILIEWLKYLKEKANIVKLSVLNAANAFVMFETLNDRGLKTSQADLVKNFLFGKAEERLIEAQRHWSSMRGAVETIGDEDDLTMEFLRLACCVMTGATRERDVMDRVQLNARSKSESIKLLVFFDELSQEYAAILNSDHPKWNEYDKIVRKSIQTINLLGVTQIRPLMLAVAKYFSKAQTAQAFRKMVSWSVRFMVMGIRGGRLDEGYSKLANAIYKGDIKSDADLKSAASAIVTSDAEFKTAFETTKVGVAKLARYYLRSLEITATNQSEPEFIPNDATVINLEHIMPQSPGDNWPHISDQEVETHLTRLGNMVLIQAGRNALAGNLSFDRKKKIYAQSSFILTSQVAGLDQWTTEEIDRRQKYLAELAVKTWPL